MSGDARDFGARLRAAREARGISLKEIAAATKISMLALEALERNDVSRLPGGVFSRAFVRAYAQEVGLNPEQTVREFTERFSDGVQATEAAETARIRVSSIANDTPSHSGVRWLGLFVTIALIVVWVAAYRYYSRRTEAPAGANQAQSGAPPAVPPPPALRSVPLPTPPTAELQPAGAAAAQERQSGAPTIAAAPATERSTAPAPSPTGQATTQPGATSQTPQTQAATPSAAATTPVAPTADLPLRIVLAPRGPCWVSASVDGKRIVGRTLQPGEKLELAAADAIVLTVGDAAALSYTVNNAPGRSLGAAGQVVSVVIKSSNYQTFIAGRS